MRVLVTGGTGLVGSHVTRELIARGATVTVLTRDAAKAASLPPGVSAVTGNLTEAATVRSIFKGMDAVFLLNAVSPMESHEGLMSVTAMREVGVPRVVYLSVQNADGAAWLPHFGAKVGIETAIRRSGIPHTILRPNNFYQNDYWARDALLKFGVYPQPIGSAGLSRVDVRDIGEAAALALTTRDHAGETYDLAGPDVITGESAAQLWSQALKRGVVYGGDDLDRWEQQSLQYMPPWMAFDFKAMYAFFQAEGLKATPEAIERQTALIGHAPRPFGAFVAETAAAWLK
ncbi:MAG TPA: NmrA family NAD(P)-binding protein [Vicinamibacterales bacterium]|nr:NmrA family NAD(P)-binding protein [Vicinamibacterales bacterium]